MRTLTEELLTMLQQCANKLLLAYDETLSPDVWEAFEKTADACETLAFQHHSNQSMSIH
ncbi:hypothetical protein OQJ26_18290 [Legionella sp. PATHC038]|uniref:Uncharacterized protein n=1 Tax=Fluoribacter dumoffii TaxID=463 RepID=A0A377ITX1_9GAMM|nr:MULTISPECIES: hypothetical protein [Legionellaceae]HAT1865065.1 hypothetical protein [Legionella pneumophila]MCW8400734.1 hypothetical protein [Legionella sp. PATHC038]STO91661.1 Uncharacterised protein [Fluoribacter dumoffii]HAT4388936.1 hypothetical protein [Legionella pneumophila]HEM7045337.1 hypothetical protein [Legionella pneumophila]